jgi:hypothetical protein
MTGSLLVTNTVRQKGLNSSLRILNVLDCEISLETGFRGSSSYRTLPTRVAVRRTCALHELTSADNVDTDAGRSHRTPDTGHRTPDTDTGHRTPDIGRADAGHWTRTGRQTPDRRTLDPDAGGGRGQGDQGTVGIRTPWYHDTAGTTNRVAGGGGTRGARQP